MRGVVLTKFFISPLLAVGASRLRDFLSSPRAARSPRKGEQASGLCGLQRVLKVESEVESGLAAVAHDAVGKLIWSPAIPVVASKYALCRRTARRTPEEGDCDGGGEHVPGG